MCTQSRELTLESHGPTCHAGLTTCSRAAVLSRGAEHASAPVSLVPREPPRERNDRVGQRRPVGSLSSAGARRYLRLHCPSNK